MRTKALRESRAAVFAEMKAMLESNDSLNAEQTVAYEAMDAKQEAIKAQIDRIERSSKIDADLVSRNEMTADQRKISADQVAEEAINENRVFGAYLRRGIAGLSAEDRIVADRRFEAALGTGTPSSGGYTIPQGFYDVLTDAQKAYGGMLTAATIIDTTTGNALPMPTDNDTTNAGAILTENTQVGTQDIAFSVVNLGAYTYTSKMIMVSNQLLQDSAFNLDTWLAQKLATRLARIVNTHMTVGTGTNQPNGIVTAATQGTIGATGEAASLIFDDLLNLEHAVDPAYRNNAMYMFHDSTLKAIKKLKDTQGRPLFLPGFAFKEPDTINGIPYVINQDMPVMAANAKSILYGDMSTYMIRRVAGTQVLRLVERYADYNQVAFVAFQRWDGNLLDAGTHPIQYFANSAT